MTVEIPLAWDDRESKKVWCYLFAEADDDGLCVTSCRAIEQATGIGRKKVGESVQEMARRGLIVVETDSHTTKIKIVPKKPQQTPKTESAPKVEQPIGLMAACKAEFRRLYIDAVGVEYFWDTAKDTQALGDTLGKIKACMPEQERGEDQRVFNNYSIFMQLVWKRGDAWTIEHMSPKIVNLKFNELYNRIKNGTRNSNRSAQGNDSTDNDRQDWERTVRIMRS